MEMSKGGKEALDELMLAFRSSVQRIAARMAEKRGADKIEAKDIGASKDAFLDELQKVR